jgi:hypothetical protein
MAETAELRRPGRFDAQSGAAATVSGRDCGRLCPRTRMQNRQPVPPKIGRTSTRPALSTSRGENPGLGIMSGDPSNIATRRWQNRYRGVVLDEPHRGALRSYEQGQVAEPFPNELKEQTMTPK